ncbi:MAG: hypothetical protein JXX29_14330 [Deltaproteobacteria bacterium]|nr:hypothetical protein [Deltaproteobacteria bacterium]MBN2672856.1 hypothetical protein [Deltaproteobacteria bacterium]
MTHTQRQPPVAVLLLASLAFSAMAGAGCASADKNAAGCSEDADCRCTSRCVCRSGECVVLADTATESTIPLDSEAGSETDTSNVPPGDTDSDTNTEPNVQCGEFVAPDAQKVRQCVMELTCLDNWNLTRISDCITYDIEALPCSGAAQTCGDIYQCKGEMWADPDIYCQDAMPGWKCVDNLAVFCDGGNSYFFDCEKVGATCEMYAEIDTDSEVLYRPCRLKEPLTCDDPPHLSMCHGNYRYTCIGNKPYGRDCGNWSEYCIETVPGEAYCGLSNTTCSNIGEADCVGNVLQYCDGDGYQHDIDCELAGSRCSVDDQNYIYCAAPGCTTDIEAGCEEGCHSDTIMRVCVGGAPYLIDCIAYGFSECGMYGYTSDTDNFIVGCSW